MPIPFVDLKRQYAELQAEISDMVTQVLSGGTYILGPEVECFEKEWAAYCGVATAAGVATGTDALSLALIASGAVRKGHGDEVITSTLTSPYTALGIVNAGGVPVFADIDPDTYTLDPEKIETSVTSRTRAIVPVHLYGRMAEMEAISAIAKRRNLIVIEDAAQAHGARPADGIEGRYSMAAAYSFYPTKNLGAYGDGGAVISNDPSLIQRIKIMRQGGHAPALHSGTEGRNSRLDELQAAVMRIKLKRLDNWNDRRKRLAEIYTEALQSSTHFRTPTASESKADAHHLYVIQHPERNRLQQHLAAQGIETLIHYPQLLHQLPIFKDGNQRPLPIAEKIVGNLLSLPLYPQLEVTEVNEVIHAAHEYKNQM
jgi:dTDP-4-amino-4,6-dideoxygalactose transaminase